MKVVEREVGAREGGVGVHALPGFCTIFRPKRSVPGRKIGQVRDSDESLADRIRFFRSFRARFHVFLFSAIFPTLSTLL